MRSSSKSRKCKYEVCFWLESGQRRFVCETSRPILSQEDVEILSSVVLGNEHAQHVPEFKMISEQPRWSYESTAFSILSSKADDPEPQPSPAQQIEAMMQKADEAELERLMRVRGARQHFSRFRKAFVLGSLGLSEFRMESVFLSAPSNFHGELDDEMAACLYRLFWTCLACVLAAPFIAVAPFLMGLVGWGATLCLLYGLLLFLIYTSIQVFRTFLRLERMRKQRVLTEALKFSL